MFERSKRKLTIKLKERYLLEPGFAYGENDFQKRERVLLRKSNGFD